MRKEFALNFNWFYSEKSLDNKYNKTNMEVVNIPHNNFKSSFNNFSENIYQFESVYIKDINIDKKADKRYFLNFEGVLHLAKVYVNEVFVGEHLGGYVAFEFEVTKFLKNGDNEILVEVDSRENLNTPPFGKTIDYLTFGGIYREVTLKEVSENYIKSIDVTSNDLLGNATINTIVKTDTQTEVTIELINEDEVVYQTKGLSNETISFDFNPKLWDTENPHLYTVVAKTNDDEKSIRTGFKEVEFKTDGFYLNGIKTMIIGLNRHQIYPYVGYAMPKSGQVKDAEMLRKIGNAVRTSHYPQSQHFMDACNELGLLVFTEAPGWQSIGDQEWQDRYLEQVEIMVEQYRHHPSIILWGVRVNESGDNTDLYTKTNAAVRRLDNRPTSGVRDFGFSEYFEDVYSYNDFFHNGTNNYTKDVDEVIPSDYPYMITEFNGHMFPTKSVDNSMRKLDHALRYAHILNAHIGNPRVSGSFGWQFIDYYTHKEFSSGDNICYHGIYDMFRIGKPAAKVYESQYSTVPYLEPLHNNSIGDFNGGYIDAFHIASNAEFIKVYKNDVYLDTFYPRKDIFPNLEHPLYILDDLYGDSYEKKGYSKEEAKEYKELAHMAAKRGGLEKLTKHDDIDWDKMKIGWDMYGSEIANWGSDRYKYKFVGTFKGEEITREIGAFDNYEIKINVDNDELVIDKTYDVTRVSLEAIDNLGNLLEYASDSFMIETNDNLELIGERFISLIGGKRAFWVKTKNVGEGIIKIKNDHIDKTLTLNIK